MATSTTTSSLAPNSQNNTTTLANGGDADTWLSTTPRIVFLSVFIGFGFFGNLSLVITICQSRRFRSTAFFVFLVNLAVVNMCECLLNMSLIMASTVLNEWNFGELACRVNTFCLHLICKETFLALTVTTADRFVAVKFKEKYDHVISTSRIVILITFTWVQAFSFSVPIAAGALPTAVNTYILYCTITKGSSLAFTVVSAILCLLVPFMLIIVFFVKIARTGYKDRYFNRSLEQQRNYNDENGEEPRFKQDFRHTNLTATLCIAWLVLDAPHVLTSYFAQLSNSDEINDATLEEMKYVWYVDLVLLWLRFSYSMALPIAAFAWSKDLWKSFKDFILCRKNNSVVDESFKKADSDTLRLEKKIKEERIKEKESMVPPVREQRVFQVPVLFATSQGVHVKTGESSDSESEDTSTKTGTWKGKKCDVEGSRDHLNHIEDDTSDYDSGSDVDPFSVSHPVSVHYVDKESGMVERKRSLSEPEVRDKKVKVTERGNSVAATSNGDSGVDLNTSHDTTTTKFHVPSVDLMLQNTQLLQTEILGHGSLANSTHERSQSDSNYAAFPTQMTVIDENDYPDNTRGVTSDNVVEVAGIDSGTYQQPCKQMNPAGCNVVQDSPLPKRKKKRRKDKNFDTQSITSVTSNGTIPPRPPARLAPLLPAIGVKGLPPGPGRPGSSCSSHCSMLDSTIDFTSSHLGLHCDSCGDVTKTDVTSFDNVSISSFNMRRSLKGGRSRTASCLSDNYSNNLMNADFEPLQLDCKREIDSVPEEILTPSECHVQANISLTPSKQINTQKGHCASDGILNEGFEHESENREDDTKNTTPLPTKTQNTEARRKRREKQSLAREMLTSSTRTTDGYKRLVPEVP